MDKNILLVKSDIEHTRSNRNKDLVSFHKRMYLCFNETTLQKIGLTYGMYARYMGVDFDRRVITMVVRPDKPEWDKTKWYKITNPQVSKHRKYYYIRTTNLLYEFNILPLGAFNFEVQKSNVDRTFVYIYF